jgi:hypothetical protein
MQAQCEDGHALLAYCWALRLTLQLFRALQVLQAPDMVLDLVLEVQLPEALAVS